ncbi:hypothetical protein V9T40_001502 [Parthenolecanium corni]|uniref:Uncharacterized protein n=1 Tax=Parthenolecanium corni TaxID=536013 RepID=A0AAN9TI39_9HEMI
MRYRYNSTGTIREKIDGDLSGLLKNEGYWGWYRCLQQTKLQLYQLQQKLQVLLEEVTELLVFFAISSLSHIYRKQIQEVLERRLDEATSYNGSSSTSTDSATKKRL